jgi:hypothetical protein
MFPPDDIPDFLPLPQLRLEEAVLIIQHIPYPCNFLQRIEHS